jgi:hypothetical protein
MIRDTLLHPAMLRECMEWTRALTGSPNVPSQQLDTAAQGGGPAGMLAAGSVTKRTAVPEN